MSIKKTIIAHSYNEEYLLPWWLNHHKKIFDHGIIIDYDSSDKSVEICKDICPHWNIVKSKNTNFNAKNADVEVEYYESQIQGWKISLNITEFLLGPIDKILSTICNDQLLIPSVSFFDWEPKGNLDSNKELWHQKYYGIDYITDFMFRRSRSFHNKSIHYELGRHFHSYNCEDLLIFHYGNCISSPQMLNRRLQIQHRIPQSDKIKNLGFQHHNFGLGLTSDIVHKTHNDLMSKKIIKNQSFFINKVLHEQQTK